MISSVKPTVKFTWTSATMVYSEEYPAFMMGYEIFTCSEISCIEEIFSLSNHKTVYFLYFTKGLEHDPVTAMQITWISHLFSFSEYESKVVIAVCDSNCNEFVYKVSEVFPDPTIFVSFFPHSYITPNILEESLRDNQSGESIIQKRRALGYSPPLLIHGNHEQPWRSDESSVDFIGSIEKVSITFSRFYRLIINNIVQV